LEKVGARTWKYIFVYYLLLVRALVIVFPLWACWAVWEMTINLEQMPLTTWKIRKPLRGWKLSSTSLSSADASISQMPTSKSSSKLNASDSGTESEDD
jgi:hypothetical protein